jgi:predicted CxxxxCH...CXXCH cytochrome family protein
VHYNNATAPAVIDAETSHTDSGYTYGCGNCHPNVGEHATGPVTADLQAAEIGGANLLAGSYTANAVTNAVDAKGYDFSVNGTCDTIYCHSTGDVLDSGITYVNASWNTTATGNCDVCHDDATSTPITTNAHGTHVADGTYDYKCGECHADTVGQDSSINTSARRSSHVDNSIDVVWVSGGKNEDADAYASQSPNCANNYCHSKGLSNTVSYGFGNAPYVAAKWNGVAMDCDDCHGWSAGETDEIETGAHQSHIANTSYVGKDIGCAECHAATASSDSTISTHANHVDKQVNVQFDDSINLNADNPVYNTVSTTGSGGSKRIPGDTAANCQNVYCHSIGNLNQNGQNFYNTIAWDDPAIDCDDCHGDTAGKSHPVYSMAGFGNANSHVKHVEGNNYACAKCHIDTTPDGATINTVSGAHINRTEDVVFNTTGGQTGTYNSGPKTCSATYCHSGTTPTWGGSKFLV